LKGGTIVDLDQMILETKVLLNKYPYLNKEEIEKLRVLSNNISSEMSDALYDMSIIEKNSEQN
jgi:hypothetical protein